MRSFDSIESSPQEDVADDKKETSKMSDDPDSTDSAKNAQKDQDSHAEEQLKDPSPDHSAICISDSEGDSPICLSSSVQEKSAEPSPVKRPSDNEDTKSNKIINVWSNYKLFMNSFYLMYRTCFVYSELWQRIKN